MTGSQSHPDELDRLFSRLVRTIRSDRPEFLAGAFEVVDLLSFVPYKAVRSEIGADTEDDYAHTVTRLLAGERGLVFVDDLMQDDLQNELKSPNPDLQAYRSYLNTRVTLAQERVREVLDALGPAAPRDALAPAAPGGPPPVGPTAPPKSIPPPTAPTAGSSMKHAPPRERPMSARPRAVPSATTPVGADGDARPPRAGCQYCGQPLPLERDIRFCPHCGQDLSVHRCGACSAELEPGWKFCVACGRAASA